MSGGLGVQVWGCEGAEPPGSGGIAVAIPYPQRPEGPQARAVGPPRGAAPGNRISRGPLLRMEADLPSTNLPSRAFAISILSVVEGVSHQLSLCSRSRRR